MPRPEAPHIALLCATQRGAAVLRSLAALLPQARLTVFSFPEAEGEPRYLEEIRDLAGRHGGRFVESRHPDRGPGSEIWEGAVDVAFLVHWRYRLSADVLHRARRGAFVFHDSLLPAYRGFSPTVWAVANGEPRCGATLFRLASDVDTGPIVGQRSVEIGPAETISVILPKVTAAYLELLERHLVPILEGSASSRDQDESLATWVCKRVPEDNRIDWRRSTGDVHNLVRAVTRPYAGAYAFLDGRKLTVWSGRPWTDPRRYVGRIPGAVAEVRAEGAVVLTGDGSFLVETVQLEGAAQAPAREVLNSLSGRLR